MSVVRLPDEQEEVVNLGGLEGEDGEERLRDHGEEVREVLDFPDKHEDEEHREEVPQEGRVCLRRESKELEEVGDDVVGEEVPEEVLVDHQEEEPRCAVFAERHRHEERDVVRQEGHVLEVNLRGEQVEVVDLEGIGDEDGEGRLREYREDRVVLELVDLDERED